MISKNLREMVFWGCDYISGSRVRNHLANIKLISSNSALLEEHQALQLKKILDHAAHTTVFFNKHKSTNVLEDFPVIDKNIMRDLSHEILSKTYEHKNLKITETSGSTGTPLRVLQNSNKRKRVLAEVIHANSLIGYRVGTRYAWTIASGSLHRENRIGLFIKNKVELQQYTVDSESAEKHRTILQRDRGIEIVMGYSSVLFELARHILAHGTPPAAFGVRGVLCLSEPLYPNMRETIRNAFDCPVMSRYSNAECGVLAYECPTCGQYHLNSASYIFETLAFDRDEPTPPGIPGRIVVTDLYNYAQPMIRYDTGDTGSIVPSSCTQFATPILKSLEGRRGDALYNTNGHQVMMFSFDFIFEKLGRLGKVKQFQVIQEGKKNYRLRICADTPLPSEINIDIGTQFKAILGTDAEVTIEYTDEIPVLNSGKRKYIVNTYSLSKAPHESVVPATPDHSDS